MTTTAFTSLDNPIWHALSTSQAHFVFPHPPPRIREFWKQELQVLSRSAGSERR